MVPELKKSDIDNMVPDEYDEVIELSEKLTIEWVHAFLGEMERVEDFFKMKQDGLINEFIALQDKFRIKTDVQEQEKEKDKKKNINKKIKQFI